VEGVAVVRVAMIVVVMIEVASSVVEVIAIDDRSAVGDVGVAVVDHGMAVPVASPVMPAPPKSAEESDSKSKTEGDLGTGIKDSGHGNPAPVGDDRRPVHEPGIVGGHVDNLRVDRFDDDRVALSRYVFLFVAIQFASLPGLLAHCLDGIRHILLLIGIGVAKG